MTEKFSPASCLLPPASCPCLPLHRFEIPHAASDGKGWREDGYFHRHRRSEGTKVRRFHPSFHPRHPTCFPVSTRVSDGMLGVSALTSDVDDDLSARLRGIRDRLGVDVTPSSGTPFNSSLLNLSTFRRINTSVPIPRGTDGRDLLRSAQQQGSSGRQLGAYADTKRKVDPDTKK
jgi:hypothetical protein